MKYTIPLKKHRDDDYVISFSNVFIKDAIWREWQHPRNYRGKFVKKNYKDITEEWLKSVKKGEFIKAQIIKLWDQEVKILS